MPDPVVLITGAITGIGRATALAFANEGARLVISGRHDEAGQALACELVGLGAEAEFVRADVRHEDDVRSLVGKTVERFGRLDVAVNNAGTEGRLGPLTEQTPETYAATFDTNVLGTILSLKYEMRCWAQGHGAIVNLSGTLGSRGAAARRFTPPANTQLKALTKSAALEGAALGVRINAVAPGPVETEMLNRFTGTADRKAARSPACPRSAQEDPRKLPRPSCSWRQTRRSSLPAR